MGDPMLRMVRRPVEQVRAIGPPLTKSALSSGGSSVWGRLGAATHLGRRLAALGWQYGRHRSDPLVTARRLIGSQAARRIEARVASEVGAAARSALARAGVTGVQLVPGGADRWRS